jgi:hypothetical protein
LRNEKNSHSKKKLDLTRLIFIWNDYIGNPTDSLGFRELNPTYKKSNYGERQAGCLPYHEKGRQDAYPTMIGGDD